MNKIMLYGHWTRDVELKGSSSAVAKGTLAVKRKFKKEGEPDSDFFRITAFGKQAETLVQYAGQKGTGILIVGHVQLGTYEKDGVKHSSFDVIVDEFDFTEKQAKKETVDMPLDMSYEPGDIPF